MNQVEVHDMWLHEMYRDWVVFKDPNLHKVMLDILKSVEVHFFLLKDRVYNQWVSEASYLGFTNEQIEEHWSCLWDYLSAKRSHHQNRFHTVKDALGSQIPPTNVQEDNASLTQEFAQQSVAFSEARIDLFRIVASSL